MFLKFHLHGHLTRLPWKPINHFSMINFVDFEITLSNTLSVQSDDLNIT